MHQTITEIETTVRNVNVNKEIIYFVNVLAEILLIQECKHVLETEDKRTREPSEHEVNVLM